MGDQETFSEGKWPIVMFPQSRYIIFRTPKDQHSYLSSTAPNRKMRYKNGGFNKRLVTDLLSYNGAVHSSGDHYTFYWGTSAETQQIIPKLHLQKINHFPDSKLILGDKASLAEVLQNHPSYKSGPKFFPTTYVLPRDKDALFKAMKAKPKSLFISKPPKGSCGNGIKVLNFSEFYSIPIGSVVSHYISKPLCIDSFKFDLRLYVLVTSFAPLSAFICREGLARFATESYSTGTESVYSHLTNASLNKHSRNWAKEAFKWKLTELVTEIEHRWKKPHGQIMHQVIEVVRRTLAMIQPHMAPKERRFVCEPYFEIYGFDIIFDRDFQAYLLEINTMPSLNTVEEVDFDVKAPMVAQALSIVGIMDASYDDLVVAERDFKIPDGGLKVIEEETIRQENERNRLSGDGFIRVMPCDSEEINAMLVTPPVNIPRLGVLQEGSGSDDCSMFNDDRIAILINYLASIEETMRKMPNDPKLTARVQCFLVAQGYKVAKSSVSVRTLLKHFIERARTWVAPEVMARNEKMPEGARLKAVICAVDPARVKNVKLLFP